MKKTKEKYLEIELTKGYIAIVDREDYVKLAIHNWHAVEPMGKVYAARSVWNPETKKKTMVYMHREIMGVSGRGMDVDHINGDSLDCRKVNMRVCTHGQNRMNNNKQTNNSSGYTGVVWRKDTKKWQAQIQVKGKNINLGSFTNKEHAVKARRDAEKEHFGNYSPKQRKIKKLRENMKNRLK